MIETTAMGAAFLAGLATGVWESARDLKQARKTGRVFHPFLAEEERQRLYAGWKAAVERVRSDR